MAIATTGSQRRLATEPWDRSAVRITGEEKRTFFEFSLCLSRACLGKMFVFIYKWLKTGRRRRRLWLSFKMTATDSLPRQARDTQTHANAHTTPGASFRTHRGGSPTNVNPPLDREIQDPIGRLLASKTSTEPVSCVKNGLFWSFPYVCPEPVLVKCSFAYINVKRIVLTSFRFEFSSLRIIPSLSW
eukprot:COSAG06_NODE_112_length_23474_cov_81.804458_10_plen_187_part_00